MEDSEILRRISKLVEEEHELERRATADGLDDDTRRRLDAVGVGLDQCWDLLRQRRARRHAGEDPDAAGARDPETVEGYLQ